MSTGVGQVAARRARHPGARSKLRQQQPSLANYCQVGIGRIISRSDLSQEKLMFI